MTAERHIFDKMTSAALFPHSASQMGNEELVEEPAIEQRRIRIDLIALLSLASPEDDVAIDWSDERRLSLLGTLAGAGEQRPLLLLQVENAGVGP